MEAWLWNQEVGKGWKTFLKHNRKILDSLVQTLGGKINITDAAAGGTQQSKARVDGNQNNGDLSYIVAKLS